MFLRLRTAILFVSITSTGAFSVFAQEVKPTPTPKENPPKVKKEDKKAAALANASAEQIVESIIFVYSNLRGRDGLNQVRKTSIEHGKISLTGADGKVDQATYDFRVVRSEKMDKEKIRLDQEFPNAKYALIYAGDKIFGIYNNAIFTPREDAVKSFENKIWHGTEALLRYKENESKIELGERQKIAGVDFFIINLTDKQNRKTKYYISSKTFRVMILEYEEDAVKYRRKFYDFNLAQGTLVPFRTVLWANDKQIEETEIGTVTYGQKVEDEMFAAN